MSNKKLVGVKKTIALMNNKSVELGYDGKSSKFTMRVIKDDRDIVSLKAKTPDDFVSKLKDYGILINSSVIERLKEDVKKIKAGSEKTTE